MPHWKKIGVLEYESGAVIKVIREPAKRLGSIAKSPAGLRHLNLKQNRLLQGYAGFSGV
jgi:hypothetical protein